MKFIQYLNVLFMILACVAVSFLFPIAVAVAKSETEVIPAFLIPMIPVLFMSVFFLFITRNRTFKLSTRGGILLVAFAWILACLLGAMPMYLSGVIPSFTEAFFESTSGFTTTGATMMPVIEGHYISVLFWRCQTHWLGGMGIVVLTVALFPLLGVGGFRLIKSETTGPDKGKITSKITETAKALWFIYLGITLILIVLLSIAGMDFIDACCHAFATLGTGGFSTKNISVGAYNSPLIEMIITVFMLAASLNFSLYFRLLAGYPEDIKRNSEFWAFFKVFGVAVLIVVISIFPKYGLLDSIRYALFQVASIISTTGFSTVDFNAWPELAKMALFVVMFVGGCSGSTAGSIKVIRWVILKKQAGNEIKRLLHPHGVFSIQINNQPGRKDVVYSIAGFVFFYFLMLMFTAVVAVIAGADMMSGIASALALLGNIGPGFGMIGPMENFSFFADWAKWFFSFAMLAGRLELYTMLVVFTSVFWRK
ncbi:MAG: potassium transporter [Treponema sp.]|nr:MAG: potassium transporter [Treponema sp.]